MRWNTWALEFWDLARRSRFFCASKSNRFVSSSFLSFYMQHEQGIQHKVANVKKNPKRTRCPFRMNRVLCSSDLTLIRPAVNLFSIAVPSISFSFFPFLKSWWILKILNLRQSRLKDSTEVSRKWLECEKNCYTGQYPNCSGWMLKENSKLIRHVGGRVHAQTSTVTVDEHTSP